MPIFDVRYADGSTISVEAPEGASQSQVVALANQRRMTAMPPRSGTSAPAERDVTAEAEARLERIRALREYNRRKESGFLENVLSGFGAGAVGVGELAALGGAALLDEEQELKARDAIKDVAESLRPEGGDPESATYKLFSGLGSIAGFAAPAFAGAAATALAAPAAAGAAGLGIAGALGAGAGAGEARERARAAGLTGEELTAPTLKGLGVGALEIAPVAKPLTAIARALRIPGLASVGERLATKIDAETVAGRLGQRIRSAGVTGTAEGAQEASAAILQNLIEQGYNPEKELVDAGVLEEGAIGAGAGAILQGLADFLVRGRAVGAPTEERPSGAPGVEETEGVVPPPPPPPKTTPEQLTEAETFADQMAEEGEAPPAPAAPGTETEEVPLGAYDETAEEGAKTPQAMRQRIRDIIAQNPNASISDIQKGLRTGYIPTRKLIDAMLADGDIALVDGVFVLGKPSSEAVAPEVAPEAPPTPAETGEALPTADQPIDDALLDGFGIGKTNPLRKKLRGKLGREINVITALEARAKSPRTKAEDRAKIREYIDRIKAEVAGREPTGAVSEPGMEPGAVAEGTQPVGGGVSPADGGPVPDMGRDGGEGDVGVGPEGGPAVAEAPEPGAVEGAGVPAAEPVVGDGGEPGPLAEAAPETAPEGPVAPIPPVPTQELPLGEEPAPAVEPEAAPEAEPPKPFTPAKAPAWLSTDEVVRLAQQVYDTFGNMRTRVDKDGGLRGGRTGVDLVYADEEVALLRQPSTKRGGSAYNYIPVIRDEKTPVGDPKSATKKLVSGLGSIAGFGAQVSTARLENLQKDPDFSKRLTAAQLDRLVQAQEADQAGETARRAALPDQLPKGTVKFSSKFAPELTRVAREWVRMLGITNPIIFARKEDLANVDEMERLGLYGEYAYVRTLATAAKPSTMGQTISFDLGDGENRETVHVIWVRDIPRRSELLETLAHEIGHALEESEWAAAPADVKEAIMQDYKKWIESANKTKAVDFVRKLRAHVTGRTAARMYRDATFPAVDLENFSYWGSFSEYFADQVSKWATSTDKTLKPVSEVDKFFARVAAALRKLYASLAGKESLPSAAMKKYLDSREPSMSPLPLPLPPAKPEVQKAEMTTEVQTQAMERTPALDAGVDQVNTEIDFSTPPQVLEAIRNNDIAGAVRALANASPSKRARRIFNRIAEALPGTTVEVVDDLRDEAGNPVAGVFDPATNTIRLDVARGLNNHTVLHEAIHAVISAGLANPANPLGRRLNALLNSISEMLDSAYGASSLDEFVSEALTNPEFQRKLATINVEGKPFSAWEQFKHAVTSFVRGFLGLPVKRIGSALDQVDELVEDLIAPAPKSRDAGMLYMASATGNSGKIMNELYTSQPKFGREAIVQFTRLIRSKLPRPVKDIALRLIPLNNLVDIAKEYIPMAPQLNEILQRMSGRLSSTNAKLTNTFNLVARWAKDNPEEYRKLSELIPASTYYQVDPTTSDGTKYQGDAERFKQWSAQRDVYESLSPEAQGHYRRLRNLWKEMYAYTQEVFEKRLAAAMDDPAKAKKLAGGVWQQIIDRGGVIDPYFPLMREGKFWLSYNGIDPVTGRLEFFTTPFETKEEREKAQQLLSQALLDQFKASEVGRQQLQAAMQAAQTKGQPITEQQAAIEIANIQPHAKLESINYKSAPPTSFVASVLQTLKAGGVKDEQVESILNIYIQSLPEKSFLHSYTSREGYRGFIGDQSPLTALGVPSGDILTAMAQKARNVNRQLIQLEFGAELRKFRDDMKEYVDKVGKQTGDNDTQELFAGVLDKMADFAESPRIATWSKIATSLGFGMTLGLNISTAMLNLMQLPMIVAPYLTGEHSISDVAKALTQAWSILRNSGIPHNVEVVGADVDAQGEVIPEGVRVEGRMATSFAPSIDNYDLNDPNTPQEVKDLDMLIQLAKERGALHRSLTEDVIDLEDPAKVGGSEKWQARYEAANRVSGFLFHMTEKVNRQVTLIAAYNLELNKIKKDKGRPATPAERQAAAEKAIGVMEITNGSASAAAAPQLAQNSLGKVIFLFKRFGLSMYSLMYQVLAESMANADPQARKIARRQLAGIFGGAALYSGAQGMPLFGAMAMLHDLMSDDDEDDFETLTRKYLGEAAYGGIANYALGVDVASRIGLSELVFRSNPMAKDQSVFYDLLETLGGPVVGVGMSIERGASLVAEGNIERGVEAMMPAAVRNVLKSIRFSTEGARTLRGDPIVDDIGPYGALTQAFGFAPAEYIRQLEQNANLKRIDRVTNEERTKLLRKYYVARREGDARGRRAVRKAMQEFNRKHPQHRITPETIERSMKSHLQTTQRMHHGVTFSPKNDRFLRREASEYDENVTLFD